MDGAGLLQVLLLVSLLSVHVSAGRRHRLLDLRVSALLFVLLIIVVILIVVLGAARE